MAVNAVHDTGIELEYSYDRDPNNPNNPPYNPVPQEPNVGIHGVLPTPNNNPDDPLLSWLSKISMQRYLEQFKAWGYDYNQLAIMTNTDMAEFNKFLQDTAIDDIDQEIIRKAVYELVNDPNKQPVIVVVVPDQQPPAQSCCCEYCLQCARQTAICCGITVIILCVINILVSWNVFGAQYPLVPSFGIWTTIGAVLLIILLIVLWKVQEKYPCFAGVNVAINVLFVIGLVIFFFCLLIIADGGLGICFDADSIVTIKRMNNVMDILLRDIEIGDSVLTLDPEKNSSLFWDEILIKIHYDWYDQKDQYVTMRTLCLENNVSSITLSPDHFIFINNIDTGKPMVIQAQQVKIGDKLYYYDHGKNDTFLLKVSQIDENVKRQKRVIFGLSEYVLINNIVASPFVGPHPIYHTMSYKLVSFTELGFLRYFSYQPLSSLLIIQVSQLIYATYFVYSYITEVVVILVGVFIYKDVFCKISIKL